MKKRMMAMLMTAILIIAAIPFTAFAEEAPAEVLGGEVAEAAAAEITEVMAAEAVQAEEAPAAEEPGEAFTEAPAEVTEEALAGAAYSWEDLQKAINDAVYGSTVVMHGDVIDSKKTGPITIPKDKKIILDLDGNTIDRGLAGGEAQDDGMVIKVKNGATLVLKDSTGGGKITGGNNTGNGGGVYVSSRATFRMTGGEIFGNVTKSNGGGVHLDNDTYFYMSGGTITKNTCLIDDDEKHYGGGVFFTYASAGTMTVGGSAVVKENELEKAGVKTVSNVYTVNNFKIGDGSDDVPAPAEKMSIGFSMAINPGRGKEAAFTNTASEGDEKRFVSDYAQFRIVYNSTDSCLYLQNPNLTIESYKTTYNVGEQIRLTISAPFVEDGTEVLVKEGPKNEYKVKVTNGTASFLVNAVEPGRFNYEASIEKLGLNANVWVTVIDAPKTYFVVRFSTDGGAPVPGRQQVIKNGKATRPQIDPAKDGYVFAGWYADAGCTNPYDFNMPVDRDITIFAKWNKKSDPTPSSDDSSEPVFTGTWNNPVKNGVWKQDANGVWSYTTTQTFRSTWGYIVNPFAKEGQHQADWFYFDQYGHMLTGWQQVGGKWYYLNPTKDGTLGACLLGPGKTPDGWEIDASGAWTGK